MWESPLALQHPGEVSWGTGEGRAISVRGQVTALENHSVLEFDGGNKTESVPRGAEWHCRPRVLRAECWQQPKAAQGRSWLMPLPRSSVGCCAPTGDKGQGPVRFWASPACPRATETCWQGGGRLLRAVGCWAPHPARSLPCFHCRKAGSSGRIPGKRQNGSRSSGLC